jgi:hypothetical protein
LWLQPVSRSQSQHIWRSRAVGLASPSSGEIRLPISPPRRGPSWIPTSFAWFDSKLRPWDVQFVVRTSQSFAKSSPSKGDDNPLHTSNDPIFLARITTLTSSNTTICGVGPWGPFPFQRKSNSRLPISPLRRGPPGCLHDGPLGSTPRLRAGTLQPVVRTRALASSAKTADNPLHISSVPSSFVPHLQS